MSPPRVRHNGKPKSEGSAETPFGIPPTDLAEMPFNPFRNNSTPVSGVFEYIRLTLMLPVLLFRVVLLLTMFILGYLFTKIALLGATDILTKYEPQPSCLPFSTPSDFLPHFPQNVVSAVDSVGVQMQCNLIWMAEIMLRAVAMTG